MITSAKIDFRANPFCDVIRRTHIFFHSYADDIQVYVVMPPDDDTGQMDSFTCI